MGYTHSWTQKADIPTQKWIDVRGDIEAILKVAQHERDIPLANAEGSKGTSPEINENEISFNGVEQDGLETMSIQRIRNERSDRYCKTEQRPYDIVVTACLCYLSSITQTHAVASDGHGADFLNGLELARQALPKYANQLDLPLGVMEDDRWCSPFISRHGDTEYDVRFCVDGKGYVFAPTSKKQRPEAIYVFATHIELAKFLDANKRARFKTGGQTSFGPYGATEPDIWDATGSFDQNRRERLAKAQIKVLKTLFPAPIEHQGRPPLFVRPNQFPDPVERRAYYYSDLLNIPTNQLAARAGQRNPSPVFLLDI